MKSNRLVSGRRRRRSIVLLTALMLALSVVGAQVALAVTALQIEIDEFINDTPGSTHELESGSVPDEFVGRECTVTSLASNQNSVHPGNDFIVSSGSSQVTLSDVERSPGAVTVSSDLVVLGDTVTVDLFLGSSDGIFSGSFTVVVDCPTTTPEPGQIIVVKQVTDGSDTSQVFDFTASYDSDGFSLSDGQQNASGDLDAGTYSVAETVPDGWTLESAVCDDQSSVDAIDLAAGETVTCTFTNAESDVGASITVTVAPGCEITGAGPSGRVNVTISVAGGAEVVVRDSTGQVVGTLGQDGTINVTPGATYTWEATPNGGFVFPPGFVASGSVIVEDCAEVGASILVTVGSSCVVSGTEGIGRVTVNMSVAGGAQVVVRDSDGDVVGTLTGDGSIEVPEGEVYTWVATPNPGFEFPAGFDNTGSVSIETCSNPEVLPFTGLGSDDLAALGIVLLMAGGMTLVTASASTPKKS